MEAVLAGEADRLKGYIIATEVYGRDEDFDPRADPIVRLKVGRLRRELEHYYLTAGRTDPIVISIPKGGNAPAFETRATMEAYRAAAYAALGRETEAREVIALLNVRPGEISPESWIRRWTPSQENAERAIGDLHCSRAASK